MTGLYLKLYNIPLVTTDLVHGIPVSGDDRLGAPVERTSGTPAHRHPDVVLHLRGPGTAVEEVVVPATVHHPGSLRHQALLQQVLQAAPQELNRRALEQRDYQSELSPHLAGCLEENPAGVELPDVDDRGGEWHLLVFLPQQKVPS